MEHEEIKKQETVKKILKQHLNLKHQQKKTNSQKKNELKTLTQFVNKYPKMLSAKQVNNNQKHIPTLGAESMYDTKVSFDELIEGNQYLIIAKQQYITGTYSGIYKNIKIKNKLKIDNPSNVIIENNKIIKSDPIGYQIAIFDANDNEYYLLKK